MLRRHEFALMEHDCEIAQHCPLDNEFIAPIHAITMKDRGSYWATDPVGLDISECL
jgi:hypothetical protein